MYYQYFGLTEAPFSIAVNPRYLFMSARHRDALAHLLYGVGTGGGFILLTGEVGTGKTTINRCLLEQLPHDTDIASILNPALNAMELLASRSRLKWGIPAARPRPLRSCRLFCSSQPRFPPHFLIRRSRLDSMKGLSSS